MFAPSTAVLREATRLSGGRLPLIGVGGVGSGDDAYEKLKAGASLVQLYTAMVFQGPCLIQQMLMRLHALMERDGVSSLADVIGAEVRP